jgi:hypothetical protein
MDDATLKGGAIQPFRFGSSRDGFPTDAVPSASAFHPKAALDGEGSDPFDPLDVPDIERR